MCPCFAKDIQKLLAKHPTIPGHAHKRVRSQKGPVQLLREGLRQGDGEIVLVSLSSKNLFQFPVKVRQEGQQEQRAQVLLTEEPQVCRTCAAVSYALQTIEVL